ncbi:DUF5682 family protein, partial [Streptomyces sp. NPDC020362]|uniref:DUF5682 family protein n=1 Tax=Streptomyces sp. NPDC020362 TaxID=3154486 RepID=UPI0033E064D1
MPHASPEAAALALTDPAAPYLIGVRHHAPSLAAAVPALLDAAKPDVLLVELPAELQDWVPWLAHGETRAPVALAAAPGDGIGGPAFYPFADFSPELAAVRWAARHAVRVIACDLPLADRAWHGGNLPDAPGTDTESRSEPGGRAPGGAPDTGSERGCEPGGQRPTGTGGTGTGHRAPGAA